MARRKGSKDKQKRKKRINPIVGLVNNPYELRRQNEEDFTKLVGLRKVRRYTFDPDKEALIGGLSWASAIGAGTGIGLTSLNNKRLNKKLKTDFEFKARTKNPRVMDKLQGIARYRIRKASIGLGIAAGIGMGYRSYKNAKKANDDYGLKYNSSFAVVNFARPLGAKDKKKRRQRITKNLVNMGAASLGFGIVAPTMYLASQGYIKDGAAGIQKAEQVSRAYWENQANDAVNAKKTVELSKLRADYKYANKLQYERPALPGSVRVESKGLQDFMTLQAKQSGRRVFKYAQRVEKSVNNLVNASRKAYSRDIAVGAGIIGDKLGLSVADAIRRKRNKK